MKTAYTYTILRYVHDSTTGEFVNVGVALFAPGAPFAGALCRDTYGRVTRMFPGANGEAFKAVARHIEGRFADFGARFSTNALEIEPRLNTALEIAHAVFPPDESAFQWSELRSGLTKSPSATLDQLFDRLVMRYEQKPANEGRSNEDVWKRFKRNLEVRHVLSRFRPKVITGSHDDMEFKHSYLNERWHCLEPLSFDQTTADGIKDKARRLVGQIIGLQGSAEPFKVYLLVGGPQEPVLKPVFQWAVAMLEAIPVEKEIVREDDADSFTERLAELILAHEGEDHGRIV